MASINGKEDTTRETCERLRILDPSTRGTQKTSKKGQNRQVGFDPVRFMHSLETHCLIGSRTDLDAAGHHANILKSSKKIEMT